MPQLSCAAAEETGYPGSLMICVTSSVGFFPVVGATVTISDSASPEQILETLTTDESGQTTSVLLPAPNPAYSQSPSNPRPYTDYIIEVQADGYDPVRINGAEILPDESSILPVSMTPTAVSDTPEEQDIFIPDHTLYGEYPAKIPEAEIKTEAETGEIVLNLCNLAGEHHLRQYSRHSVLYPESCIHRMVSCKGLFLYHHLFHRLRPEIHLRQKYLQQHRPPRGLHFCKLSLPPRRAAADLYQLLRRKSRQLSGSLPVGFQISR